MTDGEIERVLRGLREVEGAPGMEGRVLAAVSEEALALKAAGRGWDGAWKPPVRAWGVDGALRGLAKGSGLAGAVLAAVLVVGGGWLGYRVHSGSALPRVASLREGDGVSAVSGRPVAAPLARADVVEEPVAQAGTQARRAGQCFMHGDTLGCRSEMQTSGAKAPFASERAVARLKPCPSEGGALLHGGSRAGLYDSGSLPGGTGLEPCAFESGSLPVEEAVADRSVVVSFPAPAMPLTRQERLLLRMLRGGESAELVATLSPQAEEAMQMRERRRRQEFFAPDRPEVETEWRATGIKGAGTPVDGVGHVGPAVEMSTDEDANATRAVREKE